MNFFFRADDINLNQLSRKHQWDKHGVAVVMRQAFAAIHELFDTNFHSGRFPFRGGCDLGAGASGQVEQTQARNIISLPESLLQVLPLELCKLRGGISFFRR